MLGSPMTRPVPTQMRIAIAAASLLACAAPSTAQQASGLIADLRKDVVCSASGAKAGLEANVAKAAAAAADIDAALKAIAADPAICAPLREAALDISGTRAGASASPEAPNAASSSRQAVAQALAEADARASNLKFEVGPPPPNLTKGRISGP